MKADGVGAHVLRATRVSREQVAEMRDGDLVVVRAQRRPCRPITHGKDVAHRVRTLPATPGRRKRHAALRPRVAALLAAHQLR